jgi:hypothetical protein
MFFSLKYYKPFNIYKREDTKDTDWLVEMMGSVKCLKGCHNK